MSGEQEQEQEQEQKQAEEKKLFSVVTYDASVPCVIEVHHLAQLDGWPTTRTPDISRPQIKQRVWFQKLRPGFTVFFQPIAYSNKHHFIYSVWDWIPRYLRNTANQAQFEELEEAHFTSNNN